MSLDKFMALRTSGNFALRVWTVKNVLRGHGVHAAPMAATKFMSQTKATYTALVYMYMVHGTCILVNAHPVHRESISFVA